MPILLPIPSPVECCNKEPFSNGFFKLATPLGPAAAPLALDRLSPALAASPASLAFTYTRPRAEPEVSLIHGSSPWTRCRDARFGRSASSTVVGRHEVGAGGDAGFLSKRGRVHVARHWAVGSRGFAVQQKSPLLAVRVSDVGCKWGGG